MFRRCFKVFFKGNIKGVLREFQGILISVHRVYQVSFKGIPKKFKGYFKKTSNIRGVCVKRKF